MLKIVIPKWIKTSCDEIVVVDCNSEDESVEYLKKFGNERLKVVKLERRTDFADTVNIGMAHARSEWVLITNNDVYPRPDVFEILKKHVGHDVFSLDCYQSSWEGKNIHGYTVLVGIFPLGHDFIYPDEPREVLWGNMGGLLVSREKWDELGGVDGRLKLDFDDVDVCIRAWNRGWKTVYVPSAVLYHKHAASYGINSWRLFQAYKNALMLCYRHLPRETKLTSFNFAGYAKLILNAFLRNRKCFLSICRAIAWFTFNFAYVRSKKEPCQKILHFWRIDAKTRSLRAR